MNNLLESIKSLLESIPMDRVRAELQSAVPNFKRSLAAGILALIPLWVTWVALSFVVNWLTGFGRPFVRAFAGVVDGFAPRAADVLLHPWFGSTVAFIIVIAGLYSLGRATTNVIGRQSLAYMEGILARIPLVNTIYSATKTLITAFEVQPAGVQRVVLIDFPSPEMKAVGFVTRTVHDIDTGDELAMVYVPTTPNPTSGYMEVVPVSRLTPTDWTIEEAMRFVMTGGTSGPDHLRFGKDRGASSD